MTNPIKSIQDVEAALKARSYVHIRQECHCKTDEGCADVRNEMEEALSYIHQLKQSVEAKRDEIEIEPDRRKICSDCGQEVVVKRTVRCTHKGRKFCPRDGVITWKYADEIIGEEANHGD